VFYNLYSIMSEEHPSNVEDPKEHQPDGTHPPAPAGKEDPKPAAVGDPDQRRPKFYSGEDAAKAAEASHHSSKKKIKGGEGCWKKHLLTASLFLAGATVVGVVLVKILKK
jgi:hypothetical protein